MNIFIRRAGHQASRPPCLPASTPVISARSARPENHPPLPPDIRTSEEKILAKSRKTDHLPPRAPVRISLPDMLRINTVRPKMKRPIIIAVILLVLTLIVGIERFRISRDVATPDESIAESPVLPGRPTTIHDRVPRIPTARNEPWPVDPTEAASNEDELEPHHAILNERTAGSRGYSVPPLIGEVYFVRSSLIIGDGETDAQIRARLLQAISATMDTFGSSGTVIDLDSKATSRGPVAVYAREHWNITESVRAAYQRLEAKADPAAEAEQDVEQDAP